MLQFAQAPNTSRNKRNFLARSLHLAQRSRAFDLHAVNKELVQLYRDQDVERFSRYWDAFAEKSQFLSAQTLLLLLLEKLPKGRIKFVLDPLLQRAFEIQTRFALPRSFDTALLGDNHIQKAYNKALRHAQKRHGALDSSWLGEFT